MFCKKLHFLYLRGIINYKSIKMKKLLFLLFLSITTYSNSQVFYMDLMRVESADQTQFENVQLNHYQKVAQDAVDKGNLINWVMLRKVSGIGNYEGPNYIFVNGFQKIENITEDELWYTANNTKKVLGIDPSLLTSGGTHLGRYFYKQEDYLDSGKMGKYVIMNRAKPTNNAQFIEENKTLWKPYFKKIWVKQVAQVGVLLQESHLIMRTLQLYLHGMPLIQ